MYEGSKCRTKIAPLFPPQLKRQ